VFARRRCSAVARVVLCQQAPNSSHGRHSFRLLCSRVLRCCNNTRHKDDRNEKSDDRVTNGASDTPRTNAQRRQHTQVLRSGDCCRGSVSYHWSHIFKTEDKKRSAPLAAACVYVRIEPTLNGSVDVIIVGVSAFPATS